MGKCGEGEPPFDKMTELERERALHANEVFCRACEERGIHISEWQNFEAWQDYVEGRIDDSKLAEKARGEIEELAQSFGKYLVLKKEDSRPSEEEAEGRQRARQASRIYKEICREAGVTVCFFHDFLSWSDFVEGRIDEAEFYNRVRREVKNMSVETR